MVEFDMIQICLTDDDSDENSDTVYDKEGDSLNIFALVARGLAFPLESILNAAFHSLSLP